MSNGSVRCSHKTETVMLASVCHLQTPWPILVAEVRCCLMTIPSAMLSAAGIICCKLRLRFGDAVVDTLAFLKVIRPRPTFIAR